MNMEPIRTRIRELVKQRENTEDPEDAFFVFNEDALSTQFSEWRTHLPEVAPHYAVKCNSHPLVLKKLLSLGSRFDCASKQEIDTILDLGADPNTIVYANPVKAASHLRHAAKRNVKLTTFDNGDELHKVALNAPEAELLLRIETDDTHALCSLSCKYGASVPEAKKLLKLASELKLQVVGVAFHVGSGGATGDAHRSALKDAGLVFDAASELGFKFKYLDIGGGFEPGPNFAEVAKVIRDGLLKFPNVQFMGEPGRFFAEPCMTLAACVIGVRGGQNMVYISDGVYGNLNSVIYDHHKPQAVLISTGGTTTKTPTDATGTTITSSNTVSVWGPTCDGLDMVSPELELSSPVQRGCWLAFPDCGAYTIVGGSNFNGFNAHTEVYTL